MKRRDYVKGLAATVAPLTTAGCTGSGSSVDDSWEDIELEEDKMYKIVIDEEDMVDPGTSVEVEFEDQDNSFYINLFGDGETQSYKDVTVNSSYEIGFENQDTRTLFVDDIRMKEGEMYLEGRIEKL